MTSSLYFCLLQKVRLLVLVFFLTSMLSYQFLETMPEMTKW
jgi:hypothetical protein